MTKSKEGANVMDSSTRDTLTHFYRQHVETALLPFWNAALDRERGGVYTCFNNAGDTLVSTDKYTWSQGRFLWVWAKVAAMVDAGALAGDSSAYRAHLHKTVRFLEKNAFLEGGQCAFLLSETGEKKEPNPGQGYHTSAFADCFTAIGLTAYADLFGDGARLDKALALYDSLRQRIAEDQFRTDPFPVPPGYRWHAIPMIMLDVSQGLADAAVNLTHPRAGELAAHAHAYMADILDSFCQDDGRHIEFLPDDPADAKTLLHRHVNPGHAIESMWFVLRTASHARRREAVDKACQVIEQTFALGWDEEHGGLLRFVDAGSGPPEGTRTGAAYEEMIAESWDLKLWWPHAEALYATLLAHALTRRERMMELHEKLRAYTFGAFPHPDPAIGEWIQIRDRRGDPVTKVAALPVKDPYHILRSMLLAIELLRGAPA